MSDFTSRLALPAIGWVAWCTVFFLHGCEARKRNMVMNVPCKRLTQNYLRIEYAKFVEEYHDALLYSYPKQFLIDYEKTLRGSQFTTVLDCAQTDKQKGTPCQTKMLMDNNLIRYPSTLFQAQCCHFDAVGQESGECVEGYTPKHIFIIKKTKRRKWCKLKKMFQLIAVNCHWKCTKSQPINDNYIPEV